LESIEARLVVYKQNESILEENIQLLKVEVQARDTALVSLRQKLNQAEQERDDLKLKVDKFQTSSINLTELLASQTNDKHDLGYVSSEDDSAFDRLPPSGGYHAVPPPITGNFMPPKPDLVFHTAHIAVETDHSAFTVQLTSQIAHSSIQSTKQVTPPRHSIQSVKAPIPDATPKLTTPKSNRSSKRKNRKTCFSKPISTAARQICADVPKIMATKPRHARSLHTNTNSIFRRHITRGQSPKISNSPPRVTTAQAPVVSAAKGKKGKWVWRPKCPILDHDSRTT
nr:hypothetical protein [Tanacetum cinerariifolium]